MTLQDKAIDIKGKKYVLVSDRVLYFNETYPKGSITTELLSPVDSKLVVIKATVKVDDRTFTGHSQAVIGEGYINKTAALENAETSAIGRALAMMGIGVIDSIASVDEIKKAAPEHPKTIDEYLPTNPMEITTTSKPADITKMCPIHGETVEWKPAGVSKTTGKAYPAFQACIEKENGRFCTAKLIDKTNNDPFLEGLMEM